MEELLLLEDEVRARYICAFLQALLEVRFAVFCVVIKVVFRVLGPEVNQTRK